MVEPDLGHHVLRAAGDTTALLWAGPLEPAWSPRGDKIAFLAALPFDPEQMVPPRQVGAWVYDLAARRLTKITNRPRRHRSLSWR